MTVDQARAERPTVSAITIFFNQERFLAEAIESVLAQSFADWELLLVDDGSTDASSAIARGYAERWPGRIRYLEHEDHLNRGMSASRNLGLRHARGNLIAFLDSDDVWLPQKLEEQVAILRAHPEAGMVCGATLFWWSWTGRPRDIARDVVRPVGAPAGLAPPPSLLMQVAPLGEGAAPSMSNLMMRREVALRVGGFEENFHGIFEDGVFLSKVHLTTPAWVSEQLWDQYRRHAHSYLANTSPQHRYAARRAYLEWLEAHLAGTGHGDRPVRERLRQALRDNRHPAAAALAMLWRTPRQGSRELALSILWAVLPERWYFWLKVHLAEAPWEAARSPAALRANKAHTMNGLGRSREAIKDYRRALALDPDRAEWWAALARVWIKEDEVEEGVEALDRALALRGDPSWHVLRARALLRVSRVDEAIRDFQRAVELEPYRVDWREDLARLRRATEAFDHAGASRSATPPVPASSLLDGTR